MLLRTGPLATTDDQKGKRRVEEGRGFEVVGERSWEFLQAEGDIEIVFAAGPRDDVEVRRKN